MSTAQTWIGIPGDWIADKEKWDSLGLAAKNLLFVIAFLTCGYGGLCEASLDDIVRHGGARDKPHASRLLRELIAGGYIRLIRAHTVRVCAAYQLNVEQPEWRKRELKPVQPRVETSTTPMGVETSTTHDHDSDRVQGLAPSSQSFPEVVAYYEKCFPPTSDKKRAQLYEMFRISGPEKLIEAIENAANHNRLTPIKYPVKYIRGILEKHGKPKAAKPVPPPATMNPIQRLNALVPNTRGYDIIQDMKRHVGPVRGQDPNTPEDLTLLTQLLDAEQLRWDAEKRNVPSGKLKTFQD